MRSEVFLYMNEALGFICVAVWIYLICGRGGFWRSDIRDTTHPARYVDRWPTVAVAHPARNESEFIGASVQSLLRQEYRGPLTIVVVDDDSSDGTATIAARAAAMAPERQVNVVASKGPARGWTGKLWALKEGIAVAEATRPDYLLLTDADIVHTPDTVAWLVSHSLSGEYTLVSLMAKLRCESLAERSPCRHSSIFSRCFFRLRGSAAPNQAWPPLPAAASLSARRRSIGQAASPAFVMR